MFGNLSGITDKLFKIVIVNYTSVYRERIDAVLKTENNEKQKN